MRISELHRGGAVAGLIAVCACHQPPSAPAPQPTSIADVIACASGHAPLARACTVELAAGVVTVHNPDGGFHRLRVAPGRGLIAADGAEAARVTPIDANTIEVAIGADRYRLPATVKGR